MGFGFEEKGGHEKSVEAVQKRLDNMIPDDEEPKSIAEALKQQHKKRMKELEQNKDTNDSVDQMADALERLNNRHNVGKKKAGEK